MSDINGGSVDSGSVGRRAFVARSEIENESASGPELDAALEYLSLVWVYLQWCYVLWLGEKAKHDLISSYKGERKGINERFALNQLESLRLGRKNADGCFYQRGIVAYFFPHHFPSLTSDEGTSSQHQWT